MSGKTVNLRGSCSGGASARHKAIGKLLCFELATVTSQALKYDVVNFVSMFEQFCAMFYKPSTSAIYATLT